MGMVTDKQRFEMSNTNPFNFPIRIDSRKIVIIEGPNCVGKTFLAIGLMEKMKYNIQLFTYSIYDHRDDVALGEILALSRYGDRIIQDRSLLSWMYYNGWDDDIFNMWVEDLRNGSAVVICMMSPLRRISELSSRKDEEFDREEMIKESEYFSEAYAKIPAHLRIDSYIVEDGDLVDEVHQKLIDRWYNDD